MIRDIKSAHKHSTNNRASLMDGQICGCFYCMKIFASAEISEWLLIEDTALCPHCGIDSVIGEGSGYPVTEEFLLQMNQYWFSSTQEEKA